MGGGRSWGGSTMSVADDVELESCTDSQMTTLRHTKRRFVFLLSILSFKWPMCNSQGNLTEPDDNFCAIGIVATTLNSYL